MTHVQERGDGRVLPGFQLLACAAIVLSFLATTRIGQPETCERYWIVEILARCAFVAIWIPLGVHFARIRGRFRELLQTRWVRSLLAITAWLIIGALVHMSSRTWLSYTSTALGLLTAGVALPVMTLAAQRSEDPDPMRFLRWATTIVAVHVALLFTVEWLTTGSPLFFEDRPYAFGLQRFTGLFRLSPTNALFLLPFFLLAQERVVSPATRSRTALVVAAVLGIGLLATFSRSAVGIVVASSLVAWVRASRPTRWRRVGIAGAAVVAGALAVAVAVPRPWREDLLFATRLEGFDPDFVLNHRLLIWGSALEQIMTHPILGTGDWIVPTTREPHDAHNIVLCVAYTYGLPAMVLALIPVLIYLRRPRRHRWLVIWLLAEYAFHGGYLLHLGTPWIVMTILMGREFLARRPGAAAGDMPPPRPRPASRALSRVESWCGLSYENQRIAVVGPEGLEPSAKAHEVRALTAQSLRSWTWTRPVAALEDDPAADAGSLVGGGNAKAYVIGSEDADISVADG